MNTVQGSAETIAVGISYNVFPPENLESAMPAGENSAADNIRLVQISIVLVCHGINPGVINFGMLKDKGITGDALHSQVPSISTPLFSQVTYENGLMITAEPERFIFTQRGESLSKDNSGAQEAASNFLGEMSYLSYRAIGINLDGWLSWPHASMTSLLSENGAWVSFQDKSPDIRLNASYGYPDKRISVSMHKTSKPKAGLLFQANIHRDITKPDEGLKVLGNWRKDGADFSDLTDLFLQRLAGEGSNDVPN